MEITGRTERSIPADSEEVFSRERIATLTNYERASKVEALTKAGFYGDAYKVADWSHIICRDLQQTILSELFDKAAYVLAVLSLENKGSVQTALKLMESIKRIGA